MFELQTNIEIDASAERVWSILMDFPSYPDWNPFIRRIQRNDRVRFEHSERFRDVLVPFLRKSLDNDTRCGFTEMIAALNKKR